MQILNVNERMKLDMYSYLLGNGFDLLHKFPTNYLDFLHTVHFLIENNDSHFGTVGSVLGNKNLHEASPFIKDCYEHHSRIYNSVDFPEEMACSIRQRAKSNLWFKYLYNFVNKNILWIDFEKEIARVLETFDELLDYEGNVQRRDDRIIFDFSKFPPCIEDRCILSQFDFFFEEVEPNALGCTYIRFIKEKYTVEKVVGSNIYYIAKDEIISDLYTSLRELAELLRDYLRCFVDKPLEAYNDFKIQPYFASMSIMPNRVYSFNYTNTVEVLYGNCMVEHIHGNTNTNIVLGINHDEKDEQYNVDTTFLEFKKYFQRTFFNTDNDFLHQMTVKKEWGQTDADELFVIGHSLDKTDEDMIKKIFKRAKQIIILYHKEEVVKERIKNLVKIYGKEGFDKLREEKKLCFLPQSSVEWRESPD